jgi:hypothetical protein
MQIIFFMASLLGRKAAAVTAAATDAMLPADARRGVSERSRNGQIA